MKYGGTVREKREMKRIGNSIIELKSTWVKKKKKG